MREHVSLKLRSLLEATLTPEEEQVVHWIRSWIKAHIQTLSQGPYDGENSPTDFMRDVERDLGFEFVSGLHAQGRIFELAITIEAPFHHEQHNYGVHVGVFYQLWRVDGGLVITVNRNALTDYNFFQHGHTGFYARGVDGLLV